MDSRIKSLVEKCGFKYEVSENGTFLRMIFSLEGGRTQLVLVDAEPDTFGNMYADFDVFSIVCEKSELTGDKALKLLDAMADTKVAALKIRGNKVVVSHDLDANSSVDTFKIVVAMVMKEADRLEAMVESAGSKDRY